MSDHRPIKGMRLELDRKTELATSIGSIFVYALTVGDAGEYVKMSSDLDAHSKLRQLLSRVATQQESTKRDKAAGLTDSIASQLTNTDLEKVAECLLAGLNMEYYKRLASEETPPIVRGDTEAAVVFLDRLLKWQTEHEKRRSAAMFSSYAHNAGLEAERIFGRSAKAFADLHSSTAAVNKALDSYRSTQAGLEAAAQHVLRQRELFSEAVFPDVSAQVHREPPAIAALRDHQDQLRRERDEELALARHIGEMTAQSASLLTNLSEAATAFIAQFSDSSQKSDKHMKVSLRLAAWSLVGTLLFAGAAVLITFLSYHQDSTSIQQTTQMQLEAIEQQKRATAAAQEYARKLEQQNGLLQQRLESLEQLLTKRNTGQRKVPPKK